MNVPTLLQPPVTLPGIGDDCRSPPTRRSEAILRRHPPRAPFDSARIPSAPGSQSRYTSGSSFLWHALPKVQVLCLRCWFRPPLPSRKGVLERDESAQTASDEG